MPVKGRVVEDRNGRLMIEIKEGEEEPHMPEGIEYEKKFVPEHPYCTNWPMTKKIIEQMEFNFEEDQVAPI